MWTVIKYNKNSFKVLYNLLKKSLGSSCEIYLPKIMFKRVIKKKISTKEFPLLEDYLFCYDEKLKNKQFVNSLKHTRGLKYFLNGFEMHQKDIIEFIRFCKKNENQNGFLKQNFLEFKINKMYKFISGSFVNKIFQILSIKNNRINVKIGNLKTTINTKKDFLFKPI